MYPTGSRPQSPVSGKPDLDSGARIEAFVRRFYDRLLSDPELAPLFLDVAGVDLDEHLPVIAAYWKKMLLGEPGYDRHMMARHRELHGKHALTPELGRRWLAHFEATLDENHTGPGAERARQLARTIMSNLMGQLSRLPGGAGGGL